jgi:hypothetical protein
MASFCDVDAGKGRPNQSFSLGNSSYRHSEGAPATEESVFPYSRSQILQPLGLHQDDASSFKSTYLETLTCPAVKGHNRELDFRLSMPRPAKIEPVRHFPWQY